MAGGGGGMSPEAEAALRDFYAGTAGGMLGLAAGHPLDTVKTRLQAAPRFEGMSTWRVLAGTCRAEGPGALYRGLSVPLYTAGLINAIVFSVQGVAERRTAERLGGDRPRLSGFLGGCIAGLVQTPVISLSDLLKCQQQVGCAAGGGGGQRPPGPLAVLRQRVAGLGVLQGCLQGVVPCALREVPAFGIYFLAYEEGRRLLAEEAAACPAALGTLLAGGAAGCVANGLTHPVDVVKSRVQALHVGASPRERSAWHITATCLRLHGPAFFLRGFAAAMQRAFIVNAGTFGGYELAKAALAEHPVAAWATFGAIRGYDLPFAGLAAA